MRRSLFFFLLSVAALWGCKRTDVGPAEEPPCNVRTRTTADFEILELAGFASPNWVNYATDTILLSNAGFKAKFSGDSVEHRWYIGVGKYSTPTFSLNFNFTPEERKSIIRIPITHVVENKRKYRPCENDSGYDSVTKILVLTNQTLIYGQRTYVNVDDSNDTLIIKLESVYNSRWGNYELRITQPNTLNCNEINDPALSMIGFASFFISGYRQLYFQKSTNDRNCATNGFIYYKNGIEFIDVSYFMATNSGSFTEKLIKYRKI